MSADSSVNNRPLDYAKLALAVALLVGGLVFFRWAVGKHPDWLRGIVVVGGVVASLAAFMTTQAGKQLWQFFRAAYAELLRVVWPSRKETTQMTLVVFGFVVIMSIFLWAVDKTLEWTLFDLLLGWRK